MVNNWVFPLLQQIMWDTHHIGGLIHVFYQHEMGPLTLIVTSYVAAVQKAFIEDTPHLKWC